MPPAIACRTLGACSAFATRIGPCLVIDLSARIGRADGEISERDFYAAFEAHKEARRLLLIVDCQGGDAWNSMLIYSAIREFNGSTAAVVYSARSAACVVTRACDRISIVAGGEWFEHHATRYGEHDTDTRWIDLVSAFIARERRGVPMARFAEIVDGEPWLSSIQALQLGFVDEIIPNIPRERANALAWSN